MTLCHGTLADSGVDTATYIDTNIVPSYDVEATELNSAYVDQLAAAAAARASSEESSSTESPSWSGSCDPATSCVCSNEEDSGYYSEEASDSDPTEDSDKYDSNEDSHEDASEESTVWDCDCCHA